MKSMKSKRIHLVFHDAGHIELVSAFSTVRKGEEEMWKIRKAHWELKTKPVDLYMITVNLNESKAEA